MCVVDNVLLPQSYIFSLICMLQGLYKRIIGKHQFSYQKKIEAIDAMTDLLRLTLNLSSGNEGKNVEDVLLVATDLIHSINNSKESASKDQSIAEKQKKIEGQGLKDKIGPPLLVLLSQLMHEDMGMTGKVCYSKSIVSLCSVILEIELQEELIDRAIECSVTHGGKIPLLHLVVFIFGFTISCHTDTFAISKSFNNPAKY